MTKKHFIALADVVRSLQPTPNEHASIGVYYPAGEPYMTALDAWQTTQHALAAFCAAQNPAFDRGRWLDYVAGKCGPNGGAKGGQ